MTLLRSKELRAIYSDNGTLSEWTEAARTWGTPNSEYEWTAAEDALFIGKAHAFSHLYVAIATENITTGSMSVSYWDGAGWVPFADTLDETSCFTTSGFIQWEDKGEWSKAVASDVTGLETVSTEKELYWIKITMSEDTDLPEPEEPEEGEDPVLPPSPSVRAIKVLFSDDRMLKVIHPEIMNYLPTGKTDYLEQHELAKDILVNDLIQSGTISYEEQIKNPEDYLLAATYKVIDLILTPIPGDERLNAVKNEMRNNYKSALRKSSASIDKDKNEFLDEDEESPSKTLFLER